MAKDMNMLTLAVETERCAVRAECSSELLQMRIPRLIVLCLTQP